LPTKTTECSNNYDKFWYGSTFLLDENQKCEINAKRDCDRFKEYVRKSSNNITNNHSLLIDLPEYILNDEL
jgi:hypothetical protein